VQFTISSNIYSRYNSNFPDMILGEMVNFEKVNPNLKRLCFMEVDVLVSWHFRGWPFFLASLIQALSFRWCFSSRRRTKQLTKHLGNQNFATSASQVSHVTFDLLEARRLLIDSRRNGQLSKCQLAIKSTLLKEWPITATRFREFARASCTVDARLTNHFFICLWWRISWHNLTSF
jgi:hypothetical protein